MKRIFTFFVMFCLGLTMFAQTNEGNPQKGLTMINPAFPAIDAYQTLSTLYRSASDDGSWKAENWHAGTANSGTWYATGTYNGNDAYRLEGPDIDLPPLTGTAERYNLYIEEQYQFESYYDQGLVMISADQGQTWQTVSSRTGQSALRTSVINLTPWAGKSIRLAFGIEADATNSYQGWNISSISLKHEKLATGNSSATGSLKSAAATSLSGFMNAPDAQKFPRFIFANLSVEDANGDFVAGLDESNFSVTEEINSVVKTVDKDATFKVFTSEDSTTQRPVDILFLMDNSGSMSDNQQAVEDNVAAFVDSLEESGLSFRLGLCRFGQGLNQGKPIFYHNGAWYSDVEEFKTVWAAVNTIDGGMEPSWDALYYAVDSLSFQNAAQKVFILITDEAITGNNISYSEITDRQVVIDKLQSRGITTYAITETYPPFDEDFGVIADSTGGAWYNIDLPFTSILNDISTQIGNTYTLRYTPTSMEMDGYERHVTVTVDYNSEQLNLTGTYVPGMAPIVIRTDTTMALHRNAQPDDAPILIEVRAIDKVPPYTQSISLFYRNTDPQSNLPYTRISMSSAQADSSESIWQATIPVRDIAKPGIAYYVQASDGDGNTTTAPEFLDQKGYPWSFAVIPNEAPVVTNQTDASSVKKGDVIPFRAEATDNTDNVANVWVYVFRVNQDITFRPYPMQWITGNTYGLDSLVFDGGTVEYFFVAEDNYEVSTFEGDERSPFSIVDSPWNNPTSPRRHIISLGVNGNAPYVEGIEVGDVIGAFYNDLDYDAHGNPVIVQECAGYITYSGAGTLFANGDDSNTSEKEGFKPGEAFAFKVQKKNTGDILNAEYSFSSLSPNTTFAIRGRSFIDTLRVVTQGQRMVLKKGINLWSTYLIPEDTLFDDMMAPYLASVTEIYDDEFHRWSPNNPASELTSYETGHGYELYTNGEAVIRVTGKKPDITSVSIDIKGNQEGSLVGCLYDAPENVETAFRQVESNIYSVDKYINDGTGYASVESYSPVYGFNRWTDKNMNPGEAYYVYAGNAINDFHFPAPTGAYVSAFPLLKSAEVDILPQKVVSVRHYMHVILPLEAWNIPPCAGDEMRAYNQSGTLAGRSTVLANGTLIILDGTKISQDEPFSLRLWSSATGIEEPVNVTKWDVGSGQYDNLKFAVAGKLEVASQAATLSGSISVSPNPAGEQVTVAFRLEEAGSVSLSLINMQGKTVRTPATAEYPEGANAVPLDVSGLDKGIYFLKVKAGETSETVKLMVE